MYESAHVPILFGQGTRDPVPFAQDAEAVVSQPQGSQLVDERQFVWSLARRLGLPLDIGGTKLDTDDIPDGETIFDLVTAGGQVLLDDVRQHPHGVILPQKAGCGSGAERRFGTIRRYAR
ncbi:hypothetical protein [Croceicoccus naphthovorans]|nr:hypothetical protein [Croceicoccus naphthovorans]